MDAYHAQLRQILDHGDWKDQRAVLQSTGTRPRIKSLFGMQARYDLRAGFPLVTTKRVPFRAVAVELLWFLSGSTNNNELTAQGVTIWNEWADPATGELGPIYGQQWRNWQTADPSANGIRTIDQIAKLVNDIRAVVANPQHHAARRLIVSAWNPADVERLRGPSACHTLAQFNVTAGRLSCQMYQRSADMFLGVPFNIASYALLTHLVGQVTGLGVGDFVHSIGDAHIYENHIPQVEEQLTRAHRPRPKLVLDPAITSLDVEQVKLIRAEQIRVEGYEPHPALRGEVAV
ncbi:thymidylate synthase [Fimbriiglobus ruber]|uniref:Thymidylate synthase n=1 Tax=Fimbriiglobus ruber TaxID=1908690 RepID=A0A225E004_9BACT|nr:thymidylate synthase [Fimbriiglobus ruber]OWK47090.1 Thymidylate synthase [Fimbriiglobus ruber]